MENTSHDVKKSLSCLLERQEFGGGEILRIHDTMGLMRVYRVGKTMLDDKKHYDFGINTPQIAIFRRARQDTSGGSTVLTSLDITGYLL
jgi:hypothetical protein